jgi:hypothetical protein
LGDLVAGPRQRQERGARRGGRVESSAARWARGHVPSGVGMPTRCDMSLPPGTWDLSASICPAIACICAIACGFCARICSICAAISRICSGEGRGCAWSWPWPWPWPWSWQWSWPWSPIVGADDAAPGSDSWWAVGRPAASAAARAARSQQQQPAGAPHRSQTSAEVQPADDKKRSHRGNYHNSRKRFS